MPSIPRYEALDAPAETLSQLVAELANERGVSERTVWRWLATMRATEADEFPKRERECERCSRPLPRFVTLRRRYCEARCRVAAHRQKVIFAEVDERAS